MFSRLRKDNKIETPFYKYSSNLIIAVLYASFLLPFYELKLLVNYLGYYYENIVGAGLPMAYGVFAYLLFALVNFVVFELFLSVYYYLGIRVMGDVPISAREFKYNIRPFFILRNVIWGALSLLSLLPGGVGAGFTVVLAELVATLAVLFPAYRFFLKHYIRPFYKGRFLLGFMAPYLVISLIMSLVNLAL